MEEINEIIKNINFIRPDIQKILRETKNINYFENLELHASINEQYYSFFSSISLSKILLSKLKIIIAKQELIIFVKQILMEYVKTLIELQKLEIEKKYFEEKKFLEEKLVEIEKKQGKKLIAEEIALSYLLLELENVEKKIENCNKYFLNKKCEKLDLKLLIYPQQNSKSPEIEKKILMESQNLYFDCVAQLQPFSISNSRVSIVYKPIEHFLGFKNTKYIEDLKQTLINDEISKKEKISKNIASLEKNIKILLDHQDKITNSFNTKTSNLLGSENSFTYANQLLELKKIIKTMEIDILYLKIELNFDFFAEKISLKLME